MGTGTSRGKKVAPACASEASVAKTGSGVASPKRDTTLFKPLKIHAILRSARNRAQPDCHSEGQESDLSAEDEDVDGELDTVLEDYGERGERVSVKKTPTKKSFMRSRTYGLCHFGGGGGGGGGGGEEERAAEPRVQHSGTAGVNKKNKTHSEEHTSPCPKQRSSSSQDFLTRGALFGAVPTPEKQSCHSSSLAMPVILYDGSEEELMDTIEREFS
ncbi:uncharacterized protein LOC115407075 isoform X2 [Salarias fasciatus]|uniref:uncharacterized protein LOC115407075 isoform X2 n=1 Tax=Salarias fasciatus TaxID=181472 RepID=UPI001176FD44|nr:uncharacterized protein LOC115407075 isoform X2 [Salarias fasciatus]